MRLGTLLAYLLLAVASYSLLSRSLPLPVESPEPSPDLRFDERRALAAVERLALAFPGRVTGTPADEAAARWIAEEFRSLGLEVGEQRFRAFGGFFDASPTGWGWHDGINVVGTHRGEIADVILFGAHRDVAPGAEQGADDNGSGTGTLVELARALTATPHRHTYVFVSFGAEEVGLGGAAYFVNHWPEMPHVRLMLNFDMLGWRDATGTQLVDWTHLPFRATSLLYGLTTREPGSLLLSDSKTLLSMAAGLGEGGGSDSGVFVLHGYPALSFVDGPPRLGAPKHCYHEPCDTIEQVSAEALGRAGLFAEEFVRRVDSGGHLAGPREFLIRDNHYVPEWQVLALGIVAILFAVVQPGLACAGARGGDANLVAELRRTAPFWLAALGAAGLVALALPISGLYADPSWPRLFGWMTVALIVLIALFVVRRRAPAASPAVERVWLTAALALLYLVAALATNLLLAMVAGLPHLLLTNRARLRPPWRWRFFDLILLGPGILWSALWLAVAIFLGLLGYFPTWRILLCIGLAYLAIAPLLAFVLARGQGNRAARPDTERSRRSSVGCFAAYASSPDDRGKNAACSEHKYEL